MTKRKHPLNYKFQVIHDSEVAEDDFRKIPGTGGQYRISKNGVVISSKRACFDDGYWAVLRTQRSSNAKPFNRVTLAFDGYPKGRVCQISRLILESWIGPAPSREHCAAHKNGKTDDDRLENLCWATMDDVSKSQIVRGTWAHGEKCGNARHSKEQVEAARKIIIDHGVSVNLLATAMGVVQSRVREWLVKCWDTSKWDGLTDPYAIDDEVKADSQQELMS